MYQLAFKYDGMVYSVVCTPKYKSNVDLRALFADFVFSRSLGGLIPLEEAEEIVKKSIPYSNYHWL